jgi:hypothetical protein
LVIDWTSQETQSLTMVTLAKARRSPDGSTSANNLKLLVAFLLGALIMYAYVGPCEIPPSVTGTTSDVSLALAKAASGGSSSSTKSEPEGWHAINVFYGEESGLGADPKTEWFAQVHQDEILVDLIGTNGYFIDLASNDAVELSNTLALERKGWNGLCIEPNPIYWYGLSHRKCTVVGALVGGEKSKVTVNFRGVFGGIVGKYSKKLADRKKEPDAPDEERYTAPIRQVLSEFNVPRSIDYMSLDVEGAELLIMQEFPFEEYEIKVLTIERPSKQLKALLEEKGYMFLKDLAWWGETLWAHKSSGFTPEHPKIAKIKTEERG